MSSKHEKEKQKSLQEKYQAILYGLLRDEDNKYCVDCDAKGPRWASWNLGVFLCIRCAGIHRNLGVHVSKVKSVNLDSWTEEQVAMMQEIGNSRGRAVYEANIPDNFRRPQSDSSLESFIRAKYEQKKYIASEWVPPKPKGIIFPTETNNNTAATNPPSKLSHPSSAGKEPKLASSRNTNFKGSAGTPKLQQHSTTGSKSAPATGTSMTQNSIGTINNATNATTTTTLNNIPSLGMSNGSTSNSDATTTNGEVDLLGLDDPTPVPSGERQKDIFGEFLSSPSPATAQINQQSVATTVTDVSNETNLFDTNASSTSSSSSSNDKKVSKDAILALYGPSQPPANAMFGGNYMVDPMMNMIPAQLQQHPIPGPIHSQVMLMASNHLMLGSTPPQSNNVPYNMNQMQNQFIGMNLNLPPLQQQHQPQPQLPQQQLHQQMFLQQHQQLQLQQQQQFQQHNIFQQQQQQQQQMPLAHQQQNILSLFPQQQQSLIMMGGATFRPPTQPQMGVAVGWAGQPSSSQTNQLSNNIWH